MNRKFEMSLQHALGLGDRRIKEMTVVCKAGVVTEVHIVELIINAGSVDTIARTFDLIERDSEVGKSLNPSGKN